MPLPTGLPSDPALPVVAVWCVDLAREPDPAGADLPAADWERAGRFLRPELRQRHARVRGRLRRLLGAALGLEPADVPLVTGPQGKPRLDPSAGLPDLRFNLSHAGDQAAFVLAWSRDVGIDLEPISHDRDLDGIAGRWFTADEARRLRELGPDHRAREFFRLWTRKEAVLKADGTGIAAGLEQLELGPGPEGFDFLGRLHGRDWPGKDLDLGAGWAGAVAAPGIDWQVARPDRGG